MEATIYDEKEHRGYSIKVYYDPDPTSPNDWDTLGTMYNQGRYKFDGHKLEEVLEPDENGDLFINPDYLYVRVYIYDHSGISIWSAREPQHLGWDTSWLGVYAVSKADAEKEYGDLSDPVNVEYAMKCLEAEVKEWDMFCRGEVYGYEIYDEDDAFVDSCWGFYGDPDEAMQEAINIVNWKADEVERQQALALHLDKVSEPFWID